MPEYIQIEYEYDSEQEYLEHISYMIKVLYNKDLHEVSFVDGNNGNLRSNNVIFV